MEKGEAKDAIITSNPYEFILHVKEKLANDRPTLIKFTNSMKAFHNQQIEIEELLVQIKEILKDYDDILSDFNAFLPPDTKISPTSSEASNIVTPQPAKQTKKVKVVAPSSPVPQRKKVARKKTCQQVMFSPPTPPMRPVLPALKEVFNSAECMTKYNVGSINNEKIFCSIESPPYQQTEYPVSTQLEEHLKIFISKLIAKYTCNSPKYRRFLSTLEECHNSPRDMVLGIIQLFAAEDLELLYAFANLLSDSNRHDLLRAIQEYQLTLTSVQSPGRATSSSLGDRDVMKLAVPLTPTGMMHLAHHTVDDAGKEMLAETGVRSTTIFGDEGVVTPTATKAAALAPAFSGNPVGTLFVDTQSISAYSLPSIHTVTTSPGAAGAAGRDSITTSPPHSSHTSQAGLDTIDTILTCSQQQEEPHRLQQQHSQQRYLSQDEWQANQQRLKSYQYVFKVRATLREEPETYRKFMKLLRDYKQNVNMISLLATVKDTFGAHPELMTGFLQLLP